MKRKIVIIVSILTLLFSACSVGEYDEEKANEQEISKEQEDEEKEVENENKNSAIDKETESEGENKETDIEEKSIDEEEMQNMKLVFEDAENFQEIEVNKDKASKIMADGGFSDEINKVYKALGAHRRPLGYVLELTVNDAYSEGMILFVGITVDGFVNGYSVISHAETVGLGTKVFDPAYVEQFKGIAITDIATIDTISGATITSTAVIRAINAASFFLISQGAIQ